MRRGLHAQIAAHAHYQAHNRRARSLQGKSILKDRHGLKKIGSVKVANFGTLCLSAESTRCQLSKSLAKSKIRRAVPPQIQLPSGALYFRHYEVGRTPRPCGCMDLYWGVLIACTAAWPGIHPFCGWRRWGLQSPFGSCQPLDPPCHLTSCERNARHRALVFASMRNALPRRWLPRRRRPPLVTSGTLTRVSLHEGSQVDGVVTIAGRSMAIVPRPWMHLYHVAC